MIKNQVGRFILFVWQNYAKRKDFEKNGETDVGKRCNRGVCRTHYSNWHRNGGKKDKPPPHLNNYFINRNAKRLSQKMRGKFGIFYYAPILNFFNGVGCRDPPKSIWIFKKFKLIWR